MEYLFISFFSYTQKQSSTTKIYTLDERMKFDLIIFQLITTGIKQTIAEYEEEVNSTGEEESKLFL